MAPKRAKAEEAPKAKAKAKGREAAKEESTAKAKAEAKAKTRAEPEEKPKSRGKTDAKEEPGEHQATEDYTSWPVPKLKEKLKELSASTSGGKDALVERLKALAPAAASKAPAKRDAPKEEEPQSTRAKAETAPKAKAQGVKRDSAGAQKATSASASADAPVAAVVELVAPAQVYYEDGDFKVDYAKTNRSSCKKCFQGIAKDALRIGKMVDSDKFDGKMVVWHHIACMWAGGLLPRSIALIDGFSGLRPEDQEEIKKKSPSIRRGR
jgi:hypothetical protein